MYFFHSRFGMVARGNWKSTSGLVTLIECWFTMKPSLTIFRTSISWKILVTDKKIIQNIFGTTRLGLKPLWDHSASGCSLGHSQTPWDYHHLPSTLWQSIPESSECNCWIVYDDIRPAFAVSLVWSKYRSAAFPVVWFCWWPLRKSSQSQELTQKKNFKRRMIGDAPLFIPDDRTDAVLILYKCQKCFEIRI